MTQSRGTVTVNTTLYSINKNKIAFHFIQNISIGRVEGHDSSDCWFEPTVHYYFSLVAYIFTTEEQNQNDWSATNQIEYTGLRQGFIFRIFLSCSNRLSPALSDQLYIYRSVWIYLCCYCRIEELLFSTNNLIVDVTTFFDKLEQSMLYPIKWSSILLRNYFYL